MLSIAIFTKDNNDEILLYSVDESVDEIDVLVILSSGFGNVTYSASFFCSELSCDCTLVMFCFEVKDGQHEQQEFFSSIAWIISSACG